MDEILELLPVGLWIIAVVMAVNIIMLAVIRGHLFSSRSRRPPVKPVSWPTVMMHIISFFLAITPFPVYALTAQGMEPDVRAFYEQNALAGSIIIIVLVMLEVAAMYGQAHNAMETEMDKRLGMATHTLGHDATGDSK